MNFWCGEVCTCKLQSLSIVQGHVMHLQAGKLYRAYSVNLAKTLQSQLPNLLYRYQLLPSLPYCESQCWDCLASCKEWIHQPVEASLLVEILHGLWVAHMTDQVVRVA